MNNTEIITMIAEETGTNMDTVASVITSFEEFGAHNFRKMKSKYMDEICEYIYHVIEVDKDTCQDIVTVLFEVLKKGVTNKLLFIK